MAVIICPSESHDSNMVPKGDEVDVFRKAQYGSIKQKDVLSMSEHGSIV